MLIHLQLKATRYKDAADRKLDLLRPRTPATVAMALRLDGNVLAVWQPVAVIRENGKRFAVRLAAKRAQGDSTIGERMEAALERERQEGERWRVYSESRRKHWQSARRDPS